MDQSWNPYCGSAPLPADWLERWNFDPLLLTGLALLCGWAFARAPTPRYRAAAGMGIATLALLFVSPLCALSSALFSVRVGHHLLLTGLAAPLLVASLPRIGRPGGVLPWAAVHALLFWFWHAPQAYALALSDDAVFWAMQLSLLVSAMAMWSAVLRAPAPLAIAGLAATMVQMGLLGALISFAARPLYAPHLLTTWGWGLGPLEDQQLAGLIMWVPGSGLYLAAALMFGWRWLAPARPAAA